MTSLPRSGLLRIAKLILLCSVLLLSLKGALFAQRAQRVFELVRPQAGQQLQAFHSFAHQAILLAATRPPTAATACEQNQYFFYDYGKERLAHFKANDLMVSRDFTHILYSEPITIEAVTSEQLENFGAKLKEKAALLQAPSKLLEETGTQRADGLARCWFRPHLYNLAKGTDQAYPLILANLCPQGFCTKLAWEKSGSALLWVRLKKGVLNQVRLTPGSKRIGYLASKKPFTQKKSLQANAYRANILKGDQGQYKLEQSKRNQGFLVWGPKQVALLRNGVAVKKAQTLAKPLRQQALAGEFTQAQQTLTFAQWLDPDNPEVRYQSLKLLSLSKNFAEFFQVLRHQYDYKSRVAACRRLHLDPDYKPLWQEEAFLKQFKAACP